MNRKSGGLEGGGFIRTEGAGSRIWKVMEEQAASLFSRFAHTPRLCTVLGGSRSFRQFASLQEEGGGIGQRWVILHIRLA